MTQTFRVRPSARRGVALRLPLLVALIGVMFSLQVPHWTLQLARVDVIDANDIVVTSRSMSGTSDLLVPIKEKICEVGINVPNEDAPCPVFAPLAFQPSVLLNRAMLARLPVDTIPLTRPDVSVLAYASYDPERIAELAPVWHAAMQSAVTASANAVEAGDDESQITWNSEELESLAPQVASWDDWAPLLTDQALPDAMIEKINAILQAEQNGDEQHGDDADPVLRLVSSYVGWNPKFAVDVKEDLRPAAQLAFLGLVQSVFVVIDLDSSVFALSDDETSPMDTTAVFEEPLRQHRRLQPELRQLKLGAEFQNQAVLERNRLLERIDALSAELERRAQRLESVAPEALPANPSLMRDADEACVENRLSPRPSLGEIATLRMMANALDTALKLAESLLVEALPESAIERQLARVQETYQKDWSNLQAEQANWQAMLMNDALRAVGRHDVMPQSESSGPQLTPVAQQVLKPLSKHAEDYKEIVTRLVKSLDNESRALRAVIQRPAQAEVPSAEPAEADVDPSGAEDGEPVGAEADSVDPFLELYPLLRPLEDPDALIASVTSGNETDQVFGSIREAIDRMVQDAIDAADADPKEQLQKFLNAGAETRAELATETSTAAAKSDSMSSGYHLRIRYGLIDFLVLSIATILWLLILVRTWTYRVKLSEDTLKVSGLLRPSRTLRIDSISNITERGIAGGATLIVADGSKVARIPARLKGYHRLKNALLGKLRARNIKLQHI